MDGKGGKDYRKIRIKERNGRSKDGRLEGIKKGKEEGRRECQKKTIGRYELKREMEEATRMGDKKG